MSTATIESRVDVYARVTNKIIADLENGVRTWMKPWSVSHTAAKITRPLRHSGVPYQGVNVLLLWAEASANGYAAPIWMTFKQATALGAHVRKGERATMVRWNLGVGCGRTTARVAGAGCTERGECPPSIPGRQLSPLPGRRTRRLLASAHSRQRSSRTLASLQSRSCHQPARSSRQHPGGTGFVPEAVD